MTPSLLLPADLLCPPAPPADRPAFTCRSEAFAEDLEPGPASPRRGDWLPELLCSAMLGLSVLGGLAQVWHARG